MSNANQGFLEPIIAGIQNFFDRMRPDPGRETARRQQALRRAVTGLLLEMAFTDFGDGVADDARRDTKMRATRRLVGEYFQLPDSSAAALVEDLSRPQNRYTSYFEPVALINKHFSAQQKVDLIRQLWQVAFADGEADPYEDHYVRKIAELTYVSHTDFISAKLEVQAAADGGSAA
ncbi:MAG TPA: TerB family tellurite resistance protein [Burkholderiales bacterium]|nr:TerB family tellurite resistance protein [Burkholderiales bacterium]